LQLIVLPEQLRQVFGAFEMFWKISGWNCPVAPPLVADLMTMFLLLEICATELQQFFLRDSLRMNKLLGHVVLSCILRRKVFPSAPWS